MYISNCEKINNTRGLFIVVVKPWKIFWRGLKSLVAKLCPLNFIQSCILGLHTFLSHALTSWKEKKGYECCFLRSLYCIFLGLNLDKPGEPLPTVILLENIHSQVWRKIQSHADVRPKFRSVRNGTRKEMVHRDTPSSIMLYSFVRESKAKCDILQKWLYDRPFLSLPNTC